MRKPLTDKERRAFNKSRKERYQTDPAYRASVVDSKRERWRARKREDGEQFKNCLERKALAHVYGRKRDIRVLENGKITTAHVLTYTTPELASLLGYHRDIVRKWQRNGKFPRGSYYAITGTLNRPGQGAECAVYSYQQALALLEIMGRHQQRHQYLYDSDKATIAALFQAVELPKNTHHGKETKQQGRAQKQRAIVHKR